MSKKVTNERYIDVLKNGSEKDAERLCYDLLFEDLDSIIERKKIMKQRDFTSAKAKEALLPDKEKYCGECCWFYGEDTYGNGFCAEAKGEAWGDSVRCDQKCKFSRGGCDNPCFFSQAQMRHHMAVLLQYHLADEDMNHRFPGGEALEDAVVFAYKYMKVFSEL